MFRFMMYLQSYSVLVLYTYNIINGNITEDY